MSYRMEKYENIDEDNTLSRIKRNEHIYNSNDISGLSRIKTNNNVSVISDGKKTVNIEKIKSYIESINGTDEVERKKISFELPEVEEPKIVIAEEKNYDINDVLEKAREKQEVDYEENRHRKINSTQIDILKSIKIKEVKRDDTVPSIDELNTEEKTIVDLIQNIQNKGVSSNKETLFDDLMGDDDDDTVVMGINEEEDIKESLLNMTQELERIKEPDSDFTQEINSELEKLKNKENLYEEESDEDDETREQDDSFYTTSVSFNKSDFEGFDDLEATAKKSSILTKIAIVFVVLLLLGTIFIIANYVFDLKLI